MFDELYRARNLKDRVERRVKAWVGMPDTSPWVIVPRKWQPRGTQVDFLFGLDYLSASARLVEFFAEAMAPYGLSVLLANDSNVERILADVRRGKLRPHVYLDLCSRPGTPFWDLLYAAAEQGVYTIRKPQDSRWTFKAESQRRLEEAGLPVPPTVIVRAGEPDRELTHAERALVGDRCVIKPSFGEMSHGVVVNVKPTAENIAKARDYNRADDWLVQKLVTWGQCGSRQAYLRAYNVLGHRSLLWWAEYNDPYEQVTWEDLRRYDLLPCLDIVARIARMSGVEFFSTEIAITADSGPNRFCLIDYVNDACDIDPSTPECHPPEPWIKWVCQCFAEYTWRRKYDHPPETAHAVYLGEMKPFEVAPTLAIKSATDAA